MPFLVTPFEFDSGTAKKTFPVHCSSRPGGHSAPTVIVDAVVRRSCSAQVVHEYRRIQRLAFISAIPTGFGACALEDLVAPPIKDLEEHVRDALGAIHALQIVLPACVGAERGGDVDVFCGAERWCRG